jgi:large conductance mechanosensitive channel
MDTPETPKEAPKDAAPDAAKEPGKDPGTAAKKMAMDSALAAQRFAREFRDFLLKSNMLVLALAVVLGTEVNKVVQAIILTIIMPIAGVFSSTGSWTTALELDVWRFHFPVGTLLAAILNFGVIAAVVFFITKVFVREAKPGPTKTCKMCVESIHADAKRCKYCTSEV